ncbi:transcription elongation factor A N-terminal and central domain-containing protein [Solea solea]|uniref:transcription elongation factor A N-terminal and central domain-containing protein n=1 Tax=Solea solea TaxID=90069 RepID=UPI00272D720B|nr:transcription elongation factor A N-terminal and central domain-containing protein [Solea solea]
MCRSYDVGCFISLVVMDTRAIDQCVLQMEKFNADRSYGNILTILSDLDKTRVTTEQLETTDVVRVLYKVLKSCSDVSVKKKIKHLLCKWRRYCRDTRGASVKVSGPHKDEEGGLSPHSASVQAGGSGAATASEGGDGLQAAEKTSVSSDIPSVRAKCAQLLLTALCAEPSDQDVAAQLAGNIEQHIHALHKANQAKYKTCVRSKVANLRNPNNGHLRLSLLSGSLSPEAFACMSAEEMASAELRQLREAYSSQGLSERQLPQGTEGTQTQKIRCKGCGGSDCRVTQVSRGALFLPAWVRRGGPDEDAMTFVTCSDCGKQWYHSGWICL